MRLVVLGASGGIGRCLVAQGVAAGHQVTAVVRDSAGAAAAIRCWEDGPAPRVAVVTELSAAELTGPVAGQDAVVSALGPRRGGDPAVCSRGVAAAGAAMRAGGVRRIVAVSAAPVPPGGPLPYRLVVRPLLWRAFGAHYADLARMERELAGSGLDWTVVRPPKLTGGAASGRPGLVRDGAPRGATVPRADVAAAILAVLADPATVGHPVGVGRH